MLVRTSLEIREHSSVIISFKSLNSRLTRCSLDGLRSVYLVGLPCSTVNMKTECSVWPIILRAARPVGAVRAISIGSPKTCFLT